MRPRYTYNEQAYPCLTPELSKRQAARKTPNNNAHKPPLGRSTPHKPKNANLPLPQPKQLRNRRPSRQNRPAATPLDCYSSNNKSKQTENQQEHAQIEDSTAEA